LPDKILAQIQALAQTPRVGNRAFVNGGDIGRQSALAHAT
jgi:hypothetical protein